jgi:ketosteroid isomerase-like protein
MTDSSNLDLVRSLYADLERGDFSRTDWLDTQIEFVIIGGPSPGRWVGVGGMSDAHRQIVNAWEGYRARAEEYRELDDERVLVFHRLAGRGRESGIELGQMRPEAAAVYHVRDGKFTKITLFWDRDRALADLGLEE